MKALTESGSNDFFGRNLYILLAAIISTPIWIAIDSYLNTVHVNGDEAIATAATACFMAGIFVGRHLAIIWSVRKSMIPNHVLTTLAGLVFGCFIWLFIHAEFPFEGLDVLNLLLYWLPFLVLSLATGALIKLFRSVTQKQLKEAETSAAQSKSELNLLQSQLSPHFLFNTLNNLYGLSITQHERVPPLLLKLSELLRYSVYDAGEFFVPLQDEMVYINNYLEFEKIRIGDRLVLTTDFEEVKGTDVKIAPMLLIVFIENAFKHSKNTADEQIFISIELKTWKNLILFSINNSHRKVKESTLADKHSGFGLTSVNKRLELLYLNDHELTVENEDTFYNVTLRLKMK
jgi:hypothetical protein